MVALASAARIASAPHGGLRAFRPKSTRLHAITLRVLCGANVVTLPSKFWGDDAGGGVGVGGEERARTRYHRGEAHPASRVPGLIYDSQGRILAHVR